eukprot:403348926
MSNQYLNTQSVTLDSQKQSAAYSKRDTSQQNQKQLKKQITNNLNDKGFGKVDQFDEQIQEQSSQLKNYKGFQSNQSFTIDFQNEQDIPIDSQKIKNDVTQSLSYQIDEKSLHCPQLESNPQFIKLRNRMRQFFHTQESFRKNGVSETMRKADQKVGIDFSYKIQLNNGLRKLLRQVVVTKDPSAQIKNLSKVYTWYFNKLETIGLVASGNQEDKELFTDPARVQELTQLKEAKCNAKKQQLMNESLNIVKLKKMFDNEERTDHKDILPAKYRLTEYKRKNFNQIFNQKSNDRLLNDTNSNFDNADVTTQAYSNFEEHERATITQPFKQFYTTGEPVIFQTQNRFEGKSNYMNYYPTTDMLEQKLEKFWFYNANKTIQDKRRDEEVKQSVKEWSVAKSKVEEEIQRKKEHKEKGSNFQARAFIRSSWKSKNFNPNDNPLIVESSTDEEDYGNEIAKDMETVNLNEDDQVLQQSPVSKQKRKVMEYDDTYNQIQEEANEEEEVHEPNKVIQSLDNSRFASSSLNMSQFNRFRGAKSGERIRTRFHDLTSNQVQYGIRPSTAVQIQQMRTITQFNKSLPKNKQNQSLPLIQSTNIGVINHIKKDIKKETTELMTRYHQIGVIDDYLDPSTKATTNSKFSMDAKTRNMSVESAKKRIETLRRYKGAIIQATNIVQEENNLDNVFLTSTKGADVYSLSLYNNANQFARPNTSSQQSQFMRSLEKLTTLQQPGEEDFINAPDRRLPEFQVPKGLGLLSRAAVDGYRLQQMNEIELIKEKLARDNCPQDITTIERAVLLPSDIDKVPGERPYPTPEIGLMMNPFPKVKAKKKKKKKGKKV